MDYIPKVGDMVIITKSNMNWITAMNVNIDRVVEILQEESRATNVKITEIIISKCQI